MQGRALLSTGNDRGIDVNREPTQQEQSGGISRGTELLRIRVGQIIIDIEDGHGHRLRSPSVVSIFRVPDFLKDSKREAYVPKRVSLGPYHHTNAKLTPMHSHKERALCSMVRRFNSNRNPANDLTNVDFLLELEEEIRNSYEEKIDFPAEYLAFMLSMDSCFLLELLRTLGGYKFSVAETGTYYEPIFDRNKIDFTGFDIMNDILMLENQIPLIVLLKLLELEPNSVGNVQKMLFEMMANATWSKFYPFKYDIRKWSWPQPDEQFDHLLGLLHRLIVYGTEPSNQIDPNEPDKEVNDVRRIPRAVELKKAGIKFEQCDGGIKKIKFEPNSATIRLPPINITDHTEVLFRNLLALEMCKASKINYVTCYLSLMDELIDSEEDVAVLRRNGMVTNYLGSDAEVAELFNGLCKGVTLSRVDVFYELKGQVNGHYTNKFKVWFTELVKEHFSSPWRTLAIVGAITGLLLTALQTIYSIISVYK